MRAPGTDGLQSGRARLRRVSRARQCAIACRRPLFHVRYERASGGLLCGDLCVFSSRYPGYGRALSPIRFISAAMRGGLALLLVLCSAGPAAALIAGTQCRAVPSLAARPSARCCAAEQAVVEEAPEPWFPRMRRGARSAASRPSRSSHGGPSGPPSPCTRRTPAPVLARPCIPAPARPPLQLAACPPLPIAVAGAAGSLCCGCGCYGGC